MNSPDIVCETAESATFAKARAKSGAWAFGSSKMNENEFVVVILPDEKKAYEALHELEALHAEGILTVYATAVVERAKDGALSVRRKSPDVPRGTAVGLLVGGLIAVVAGPLGLVAGAAGGALRDFIHLEVAEEFLEAVQRDLAPGKFALVAEVWEDWSAPIDARMEALGGKVVRTWREGFADDLLEKRVSAYAARLAEEREARAKVRAEKMLSKLPLATSATEEKIRRMAAKAQGRLNEAKEEMEEKLRALEEQASDAKPEVRKQIDERIAELRKNFGEREKTLRRAYQLAQEATRAS